MKKSIILLVFAFFSLSNVNAAQGPSQSKQSEVDSVKVSRSNSDQASEVFNPEIVLPRKFRSVEEVINQDLLITEATIDINDSVAELSLVTDQKISEDLQITEAQIPDVMPLHIIEIINNVPVKITKDDFMTDSL